MVWKWSFEPEQFDESKQSLSTNNQYSPIVCVFSKTFNSIVDIINNDIIDVAILNNSLFTSLLKWDENWFILNIRKQINYLPRTLSIHQKVYYLNFRF